MKGNHFFSTFVETSKGLNITGYIHKILLHRDFIVIPGLGGFVSEYQPATISNDKTSITPPTKNIVFKNHLVHDDGELNNYIQEVKKVDYSKATFIIAESIAEIKNVLSEGNEVEIKELGHLYMDKNDKILFRPAVKKNLLLDTFGMSTVTVNPVKKDTLSNATALHQNMNNKKDINHKTLTNSNMGKNKNKSLGWIIASVIIAAGIAIILIPQTTPYLQDLKIDFAGIKKSLFSKKDKFSNLGDTSAIARELEAQLQKRNALYYEEDKSQKITADDAGDDIPESLISKYSGYSKFYIIAGSYKRYNNAVRLKSKLTAEGYEPEILITTEKKLYRVSYKSFTDRRAAIKELYKLQKEKKNEDIWILNI